MKANLLQAGLGRRQIDTQWMFVFEDVLGRKKVADDITREKVGDGGGGREDNTDLFIWEFGMHGTGRLSLRRCSSSLNPTVHICSVVLLNVLSA